MTVADWHGAPGEVVTALLESERQKWVRTLHWDPARAWREVETARTTWGLPGLLAYSDAGQCVGGAFYTIDRDRIEIGGLMADAPDVSAALLDAVLARAAANHVGDIRGFLLDAVPGLRDALTARRFHLQSYLYLAGPTTAVARAVAKPGASADLASAPWSSDDLPGVAELCREAYGPEDGRLFAPTGTTDDWTRYLKNLVTYGAVGELNAAASATVRCGSRIVAAAVITSIAPRTAHLAQLAVGPAVQGRRLGRGLVGSACRVAAAQGFERFTLLVAEGNVRARALYESLGMVRIADFLVAERGAALHE